MIGNDVVDLAEAKRTSNWHRRGFLDKLFTLHEQQLIRDASDPDQMVWLLWSLKESAYKLAIRTTKRREFAPLKITCKLHTSASETIVGTVFYGGTYQTISTVMPSYISTVAFEANTIPGYTQVLIPFDTTNYQIHQRLIRQKIHEHAAALFHTADDNVHIQKDSNGVPLLTIGDWATVPLTISHHGYYGAFAIAAVTESGSMTH